LDLAGNDITVADGVSIVNNGTLKIDGSVVSTFAMRATTSGNAVISATGASAIVNKGTLTIANVDVIGDVAKSVGHVIRNEGEMTLIGGSVTSTAKNGGSALYNVAGATLTVEGTVVTGAPQDGSGWPSYAINNYGTLTMTDVAVTSTHGAIGTYGVTTLTNVDATVNGFGGSSHVFYMGEGAVVTVNGGNYKTVFLTVEAGNTFTVVSVPGAKQINVEAAPALIYISVFG
jgi:hypothetical protein